MDQLPLDFVPLSRDTPRGMKDVVARLGASVVNSATVLVLLASGVVWVGCQKQDAAGRAAARQPVQVVAVEARRQSVSETLPLVGALAANEMVEIKSETEGTVQEILFQEGQFVKKGDLLVKLDETKFAASLAQAEANLKLAQATFERNQRLLQDKLISQQEFDQSASAYTVSLRVVDWMRRQLEDALIHAPFDGVISARQISPGQVISKNSTLTWLVDLDPVKVEFNVPERFLSQLRVGQPIQINVAAFPGSKFPGKVFFIAPYVDPEEHTALVKAEVPNPERALKPGMFANLDLTLTVREQAVVIPEAALSQMLEGNRANVLIVTETNTVDLRPVQLGVRLAGHVEVLSGLRGGEKVIVEGTQKVGPGSPVKLAPEEAAQPYLPRETGVGPSAKR
jgi:membrane fusion protein (multidrug efflux system)